MTDNPQTPAQPGAGNANPPENQASPDTALTTGTPEEGKQEEQPKFVTVEDLARRDEELIRRFKQSDRDRAKKIESELAGIRALLEKPGVKLDAQQEAALRDEIAARIDGEDSPGQPEPYTSAPQADPVAQFVTDIFAELGTQVTKNDPEWNEFQKVLDATWNDPKGHIKVMTAATKAAESKAARLKNNQEHAAARVSGGGSSAPSGVPDDAPASELWKGAYRT